MSITTETIRLTNATALGSRYTIVEVVPVSFSQLFMNELQNGKKEGNEKWQLLTRPVPGDPYYGVADQPYYHCNSVELQAIVDLTIQKTIMLPKRVADQLGLRKLDSVVQLRDGIPPSMPDGGYDWFNVHPDWYYRPPSDIFALIIVEVEGERCLLCLRKEDIVEAETAQVVVGRPALEELGVPLKFPSAAGWVVSLPIGAYLLWLGAGSPVPGNIEGPEGGLVAIATVMSFLFVVLGLLLVVLGFVIPVTSVVDYFWRRIEWRLFLKRLKGA